MENPPFSLGDTSAPSWRIFHLSSRVNQSLKCRSFNYGVGFFCQIAKIVQKPQSGTPENFSWVPPSHRPTLCQSFHYPPHIPYIPSSHQDPIKIPSRSHQDGLLLAEAANVSRWVPNSAIASRPSKANMQLHLKFVNTRVGHRPFHQRGTWVFRGNSWGVKRVGGFGQAEIAELPYYTPKKTNSAAAVKSWIIQDPSIPASSSKLLPIKTVLKNVLQTLALLPFLSAEKWPVKSRRFITMEKKHLTDKRYLQSTVQ